MSVAMKAQTATTAPLATATQVLRGATALKIAQHFELFNVKSVATPGQPSSRHSHPRRLSFISGYSRSALAGQCGANGAGSVAHRLWHIGQSTPLEM